MIDPMPSDIFQRGQILNNTYEIEGILGRGGTGEVYRARNQIVGRVVAIKALNARFSGKADYIELMKREEQMRNIISDSVVRYSECSRTDDGHVFLVMDYIDGPSLNDLMLERRVDEKDLLIIAHRVAEGLVTTHANGIVHRDLSPDNIILRDGKPEKAVIIDFGIAKDTATGARTIVGNEFAGKYEYAAPEQLDGKSDARSDIYSLGALLLAAYRGEVPFPGNTPGEIVRRKQMELDTNGVPEPLKGLIDWMAAPDINARPGSARELLERIEGELKPVQSRQSRSKTKHKNKGKGVFRWTAALLILAAMLAGAYYGGLLDGFLKEPIPVASPYELRLEYNPDGDSILA
ncbi:MAG TPA: serine/threonine protein kinase, partial [Rhodobacteraceae bacterium]|nr:serine/threonine protein kinase [Paracoccaceae bacterium]